MKHNYLKVLICACFIVLVVSHTASAKTTSKNTKEEPAISMSGYLNAERTKATSTLSGGTYEANNLFDKDYTTAWVEGAKDNGEGESIDMTFEKGTVITEIQICPGYYKSRKLFYANAAPTGVTVSSGKTEYAFDISEYAFSYDMACETLIMPEPLILKDGKLKITIDSVREGTAYKDTCISELSVYGLEAKSEAAQLIADGKEAVVISESSVGLLTSEAMYFIKRQSEDFEDLTGLYTMKGADVSVKAFLVYWYVYNVNDRRITASDDQMCSIVTEEDVSDIYKELTGSELDEAAYQTILNDYVTELEDEGMYFEATGDFGDAFRYPDPHVELEMKNGKLLVKGYYCVYSNEEQAYVPTNSYVLYLVEGGPQSLGGYRLNKVVVR